MWEPTTTRPGGGFGGPGLWEPAELAQARISEIVLVISEE